MSNQGYVKLEGVVSGRSIRIDAGRRVDNYPIGGKTNTVVFGPFAVVCFKMRIDFTFGDERLYVLNYYMNISDKEQRKSWSPSGESFNPNIILIGAGVKNSKLSGGNLIPLKRYNSSGYAESSGEGDGNCDQENLYHFASVLPSDTYWGGNANCENLGFLAAAGTEEVYVGQGYIKRGTLLGEKKYYWAQTDDRFGVNLYREMCVDTGPTFAEIWELSKKSGGILNQEQLKYGFPFIRGQINELKATIIDGEGVTAYTVRATPLWTGMQLSDRNLDLVNESLFRIINYERDYFQEIINDSGLPAEGVVHTIYFNNFIDWLFSNPEYILNNVCKEPDNFSAGENDKRIEMICKTLKTGQAQGYLQKFLTVMNNIYRFREVDDIKDQKLVNFGRADYLASYATVASGICNQWPNIREGGSIFCRKEGPNNDSWCDGTRTVGGDIAGPRNSKYDEEYVRQCKSNAIVADFCKDYQGQRGLTNFDPNCNELLSRDSIQFYPNSECQTCYNAAAQNINDKSALYNENCLYPVKSINDACSKLLKERSIISTSNLNYEKDFNTLQEYLSLLPIITEKIGFSLDLPDKLSNWKFYDNAEVSRVGADDGDDKIVGFPIDQLTGINKSVSLRDTEDSYVIVSDSGLLILQVTFRGKFPIGNPLYAVYDVIIYSNWINSGLFYDYCYDNTDVARCLNNYRKYCELVPDPKCVCLDKTKAVDVVYPNVNATAKETLKENAQCVYSECTGKGDTFIKKWLDSDIEDGLNCNDRNFVVCTADIVNTGSISAGNITIDNNCGNGTTTLQECGSDDNCGGARKCIGDTGTSKKYCRVECAEDSECIEGSCKDFGEGRYCFKQNEIPIINPEPDSGSSNLLLIIGGIAAVVLIAVAVWFFIFRNKSN